MDIKIIKDEKEVTIKCKNPKGRDTKKGFKLLMEAQGQEDELKIVEKMNDYLDFLEELTAENTGMTVDELDDLDSDEKDKLVGHYQSKVVHKLDFLKSSLTQAN